MSRSLKSFDCAALPLTFTVDAVDGADRVRDHAAPYVLERSGGL